MRSFKWFQGGVMLDYRLPLRSGSRALADVLRIVFFVSLLNGCAPVYRMKYEEVKRAVGRSARETPVVRVLVAKGAIVSLTGVRIVVKDAGRSLRGSVFTVDNDLVRIDTRQMGIRDIDWPVTISSSENVLKVNGKSYRGQAIVYRVKGKCVVVNKVNIEDYLRGVVPYELRTPEFEALKAQTVAARSFGLAKSLRRSRGTDGKEIKRMYDLRATVADQVYGGKGGESEITDRAVKETRGVVCTYGGKVINAMYSSTCGGKTQDGKKPYLTSRSCRFCESSPHYRWERDYTLSDISKRMGKKIKSLRVSARDKTGRAESVRVSGESSDYTVSGNALRSKLELKSRFYDIRMSNKGVKITGRGYGHGIGLCQYGAVGLARRGYNYRSILKYYYKNAKIEKMY